MRFVLKTDVEAAFTGEQVQQRTDKKAKKSGPAITVQLHEDEIDFMI